MQSVSFGCGDFRMTQGLRRISSFPKMGTASTNIAPITEQAQPTPIQPRFQLRV